MEDVLFISMDGVSRLEEGAKSIFKDVVVHRCIVHLIRNSIKYVPSKDYKTYTAHLKKVYGAPSLKAAQAIQADMGIVYRSSRSVEAKLESSGTAI